MRPLLTIAFCAAAFAAAFLIGGCDAKTLTFNSSVKVCTYKLDGGGSVTPTDPTGKTYGPFDTLCDLDQPCATKSTCASLGGIAGAGAATVIVEFQRTPTGWTLPGTFTPAASSSLAVKIEASPSGCGCPASGVHGRLGSGGIGSSYWQFSFEG